MRQFASFLRVFMCAAFVVASAGAKSARAQNEPPSETVSGVRIWRDIAYVSNGHERQKLDFYAPTPGAGPGPWPCVVYMHGGGWQVGDKRYNAAMGLCWAGYAVVSVGYRLSGDAPFPAQIEDCKAAVRYLRAHAARFNIDPNRIGASGDSAGGHLAAMLGTTGDIKTFDKGEHLEHSSRVQAVTDCYGPTNLAFYGTSQPSDTLSSFIGGTIQENPEKVQAANPIAYISADDAPFAIFHGDSDTIVPLKHSSALHEALLKAKVPVSLKVVVGGGHGFQGKDNQEVGAEVAAFFNKYLQPQTPP